MSHRLLPFALLMVGFGLGWLGRSWWVPLNEVAQPFADTKPYSQSGSNQRVVAPPSEQARQTVLNHSPASPSLAPPSLKSQPAPVDKPLATISIGNYFQTLLNAEAYNDAMALFQEHITTHPQLKNILLSHLQSLLKNQ
ncbi:MAG: hypothetical protein AAFZ92_11850, partial [Pseudomonadota bacterium]